MDYRLNSDLYYEGNFGKKNRNIKIVAMTAASGCGILDSGVFPGRNC